MHPDSPEGRNKLLVVALPALLLTNIIAVVGQFMFIRDDWHWPLYVAAPTALSIESVAVFLSTLSHDAALQGDTAIGTRAGSYFIGALAGAAQLLHWGASPSSPGWVLAALSAASPWLWAAYTKRASRPLLRASGDIPPRTAPFGSRWLVYPRRTWGAWRLAVWEGTTSTQVALDRWEARQATAAAEVAAEPSESAESSGPPPVATAENKAAAVRIAVATLPPDSTAARISEWLAANDWPGVSESYVRAIRSKVNRSLTAGDTPGGQSAIPRIGPGSEVKQENTGETSVTGEVSPGKIAL